ncbi:MAG: hypothetical protein JAZ15_10935 [Candidatus Thiodiazotropha endolucinida]|nr:hypothetical protein [Candidatus Thiodiazotropha taylori]MCW4313532.1 hypothetical protein [Candidatus Thiodiazotropha taylori]
MKPINQKAPSVQLLSQKADKPWRAAILLAVLSSPSISGWDVQLEHESIWDADGDHTGYLVPRIRYKGDGWKAHLEYYKPVQPDSTDGKLELETNHNWKFEGGGKFTLRHELYHDLAGEKWSAELTPRFYQKLEQGFVVGFDLEIDYLSDDELALKEIEIEPTIKWIGQVGSGELELELEVPVMRLYSRDSSRKDFEVEGVEPIVGYTLPLTEATSFYAEYGAPYDAQDHEWSHYLDLNIIHKF